MKNNDAINNFQVGRYRLDTNYRIEHYVDTEVVEIERHYHAFYECIFFFSGDVTYFIGNQCYYLKPGDVLLINAAQVHIPKMQSAIPPYDRISLTLDKGFVSSLSDETTNFTAMFESKNGRLIHLQGREHWEAKSLLSKIANLYDNPLSFGQRLLARCYITELLICLGKELPLSISDENWITSDKRISEIKEYVAKHMSDKLTLEKIAQKFHLSKYHLSHEFKKHTGMSLYSYIVKCRLISANNLLRDGHSIKETYSKCGYSDISIFNRAFKKEFGVSPKQHYHNTHQNQ